jgi:hypothetical protein
MRNLNITLFLVLLCIPLNAQKNNLKPYSREVIVHKEDTIIRANILAGQLKKAPMNNRDYFWYLRSTINSNIGGYSGKLLHGPYQELLDNKLITSGQFKEGSKTGTWRSWYLSGKVKEISNWEDGLLNGKYTLINKDGDIIKFGIYKNGILYESYKERREKSIAEKNDQNISSNSNKKKSIINRFSAKGDTAMSKNTRILKSKNAK